MDLADHWIASRNLRHGIISLSVGTTGWLPLQPVEFFKHGIKSQIEGRVSLTQSLRTGALTCHISSNVRQHASPVRVVLFDGLSKKCWTGKTIVGCNVDCIGWPDKDVVLDSLAKFCVADSSSNRIYLYTQGTEHRVDPSLAGRYLMLSNIPTYSDQLLGGQKALQFQDHLGSPLVLCLIPSASVVIASEIRKSQHCIIAKVDQSARTTPAERITSFLALML